MNASRVYQTIKYVFYNFISLIVALYIYPNNKFYYFEFMMKEHMVVLVLVICFCLCFIFITTDRKKKLKPVSSNFKV